MEVEIDTVRFVDAILGVLEARDGFLGQFHVFEHPLEVVCGTGATFYLCELHVYVTRVSAVGARYNEVYD